MPDMEMIEGIENLSREQQRPADPKAVAVLQSAVHTPAR